MITDIKGTEWLALNAKLQMKKNKVRTELKNRGVLKRDGQNTFDRYTYFSEAQYKMLFTELFSEAGLELKFTEVEYLPFEGTEKQANGRMVKVRFTLIDCETGFYEDSDITGEGIDKGDKGGYKAYTGALKYYLADTFMVATGDDAEKESPSATMNKATERKATAKQVKMLAEYYTGENLAKLLAANNIQKIEDIPIAKASELIAKIARKVVG